MITDTCERRGDRANALELKLVKARAALWFYARCPQCGETACEHGSAFIPCQTARQVLKEISE